MVGSAAGSMAVLLTIKFDRNAPRTGDGEIAVAGTLVAPKGIRWSRAFIPISL
jgi:hypothetical protein